MAHQLGADILPPVFCNKRKVIHQKHVKSVSLDNLDQVDNPSTKQHTFLSTYPGKLKGIKKILSLKLSKSNTDIASHSRLVDNGKADLSLPLTKVPSGDMRKHSTSVISNSPNVENHYQSASESNDNFIIVDTLLYDDSLDDANSTYETDDVDGSQLPLERLTQEIDRLQKKIDKIREELMQLQATRDENVREYLATCESTVVTEVVSTQRMRSNFEKNNQRTNNSIQMLQRKLDKYQNQLKELEERGVQGPRRIIRVVQDSVRAGASSIHGVVAKPLGSINQFIKKEKRNGSADNVSITVTQDDDEPLDRSFYAATINSDDDNSSLGSNQIFSSAPDANSKMIASPSVLEKQIEKLVVDKELLTAQVKEMKETFDIFVTTLNEVRFKNEQLQTQVNDMFSQWNDITELHQNEMMGLKQEMDHTGERIECVEYRFTERANEIEEAVDSCATKISSMEHQQLQHQQFLLSSANYFERGRSAQILLSKLLSLVISIFAVLLVVFSTLSKIVLPFSSTRLRIVTTVFTLLAIILLWKHSDHSVIKDTLDYVKHFIGSLYTKIVRNSKS